MLDLERQLSDRYPHWFQGSRARFVRPLLRGLGRFARLDEAGAFLAANGHLCGRAFIEAALEHLDVRYTVDQVERERIPQQGRADSLNLAVATGIMLFEARRHLLKLDER